MSISENDQQTELLKGIAASLKGIHSSLESLTAAVEDVSESIEKAHEPEGDLGIHLVGALKDLVSALHKKANQERSAYPQQHQQRHQQNQPRRDHQKHRMEESPQLHGEQGIESDPDSTDGTGEEITTTEKPSAPENESASAGSKKRRRTRGRRSGKASAE